MLGHATTRSDINGQGCHEGEGERVEKKDMRLCELSSLPAEFMATNGGSMELRVTQDARTGGKQLCMGLKAAYNTGDIGEPDDIGFR